MNMYKGTDTRLFIMVLLIIMKNWKEIQCPKDRELALKNYKISINERRSNIKNVEKYMGTLENVNIIKQCVWNSIFYI